MVGETVADEAELALLDVLLDGVEQLLFGDFHLGIGPAGDLNNHVEDPEVLVCEEGNVMEGRDNGAALLDVNAVLWTLIRATAGSEAADVPKVYGAPMRRVWNSGRCQKKAKVLWWRTYGPWVERED